MTWHLKVAVSSRANRALVASGCSKHHLRKLRIWMHVNRPGIHLLKRQRPLILAKCTPAPNPESRPHPQTILRLTTRAGAATSGARVDGGREEESFAIRLAAAKPRLQKV